MNALRLLLPVATIVAFVASCSSSETGSGLSAASVTKTIGAEGGTIEVDGATVTFPKDALAAPVAITIAAREGAAPEGFVSLSKVFTCEPSGTAFTQPVEMRMPFTDDGLGGTLFWSTGADPTFKDVGGRVEGRFVVGTVRHFSSGFVGRKR